MKKLYILLFTCIWLFGFSQDYYSILSGTEWKIQKIQWDNQTDHYPPAPFSNSGSGTFDKVADTYVFGTKLFNSVAGTLVYGENNANYFTIQSTSMTLAVYEGENAEAVKNFDFLIVLFYSEYQQGNYTIDFSQDNSGRHLVISNPSGKKIFYNAPNLNTLDISKSKISVYPNPATDLIKIENLKPNASLELIDSSGKLIKSVSNNKTSTTEINIKDLSSGIYYLKVDGQSVQKIIKK